MRAGRPSADDEIEEALKRYRLKYIRPECRFQPLTGSQVHQRSGAKLTAATGRAIPPCENVRRWHVGGTLSRELAATVELDPRRNLDQLDQGGSHSTR